MPNQPVFDASTRNIFKTRHQVTVKLDEDNFRLWKQQVEGVIDFRWDGFHKYIFAHTNVKSRQHRSELKSGIKGDKSISKYIDWIQRIVDILGLIDDLSDEYQTLASIIQYCAVLCSIIEA